MIDKTQDAVFLPGKIHGCEDELYIIYENPEAGAEGEGCMEIEIVDFRTILELFVATQGNAEKFFDKMPDYFHGKWQYANRGTQDFDELATVYETADFLFGRDGGLEEEMNFIVRWATRRDKKRGIQGEFESMTAKTLFPSDIFYGSPYSNMELPKENYGSPVYRPSNSQRVKNKRRKGRKR